MKRHFILGMFAALVMIGVACSQDEPKPLPPLTPIVIEPEEGLLWVRQFGTEESESAQRIALDGQGNIYILGGTRVPFSRFDELGKAQHFISKFNSEGNQLWRRDIGSNGRDQTSDIEVDSVGNVYVAGTTMGAFPGHTNLGSDGAFIRKFDGEGEELWTQQFGTEYNDGPVWIATDRADNLIIAGENRIPTPRSTRATTSDPYVRKIDADGEEVWVQTFDEDFFSLVTDMALGANSDVYVVGETDGDLSGRADPEEEEVFLRKYSKDGKRRWTRQFGNEGLRGFGRVETDDLGNVYVIGSTSQPFPGQPEMVRRDTGDVYVRKYDEDGNELWTRQFGPQSSESHHRGAVNRQGDLYVLGFAGAHLGTDTPPGEPRHHDFVYKFSSDGNTLWTRRLPSQFGVAAIAVDAEGDIYIVGGVEGAFPGQSSAGQRDGFIAKFAP